MLDDLVARSETWLDDIEQLPFAIHTLRKLRRSIEYRMARLRG